MKSRVLYIFIAIIISLTTIGCRGNFYNKVCRDLDKILSQREQFFLRQIQMIESEEQKLLQCDDLSERYDICYKIFNLSRSYKYDLAHKYASALYKIANKLGDVNRIAQAKGCQISTYTSGGLFTEASKVVSSVNIAGVESTIRREVYYNMVRYYSDKIDYINNEKYKAQYVTELRSYADSIITLSPTRDYYYAYAQCYRDLIDNNDSQIIENLSSFYGSQVCSAHHNSIITFLLGNSYFKLGDSDNGFRYMVKSVGYDVEAAARENRSIKTISEHLFAVGRTRTAEKLIEIAFEDAKFYSARHRNLEVNALLPIINKHKIATISRQRNVLYAMFAVMLLLGIASIIFAILARRNALIAKSSKRTIQEHLTRISQINNQLIEANEIKEHYIIDSLYASNEYLKQSELLLKKIDVKVKNKLYDDLRNIYKEFNIKNQKERFFIDFDRVFFSLFPNFIDEYNSLFLPEDQINLETSQELPPEVRIFALMRLGITDNERISRFLDLSINTIYTYKTKVKGKSIIAKDEFENRILQIKLSHHT